MAAHSAGAGDMMVRKGSVVTAEIAARLKQAGVGTLIAARFEAGDLAEGEAAFRLARTLAGGHVASTPPSSGFSSSMAMRPMASTVSMRR